VEQASENNNAALDAAISQAAQETNFAEALLASGHSVVVMDDKGRMVWRHPDGSTTMQ
jgi:hypothetical protein